MCLAQKMEVGATGPLRSFRASPQPRNILSTGVEPSIPVGRGLRRHLARQHSGLGPQPLAILPTSFRRHGRVSMRKTLRRRGVDCFKALRPLIGRNTQSEPHSADPAPLPADWQPRYAMDSVPAESFVEREHLPQR